MSGLAREIVKWIQSLDLSHTVRNTRRDFSNGYLVAEIFSWYYPQEIQMHSYDNGTSLQTKQGNWSQLERFFRRQGFDIPEDIVEGTIHCKPRAAALLMEKIYTHLTNRTVKSLSSEEEADFTDRAYQTQLPAHARSTASMAIKNNIANTELSTDPDMILCRQKAQAIVNSHVEHRRQERLENPARFSIRPTLGQLCPRLAPPPNYSQNIQEKRDLPPTKDNEAEKTHFTEIEVNQLTGGHEGFLPPLHTSAIYSQVY